jgi:effector-binding domain-containing protein
MAVAIPVKANTAASGGGISAFEIPAGKALVVDHFGDYNSMTEAHTTLAEFVKANNLKEKAPVIEEYVIGPETERDTAKWLTKVYYFVEK